MATIKKLPGEHIGSMMLGMDERFGFPAGMPDRYVQVMPTPQGPESLEYRRILEEVLGHLLTLETLQPYFGGLRDPSSILSGYAEESGETPLDYRSMPPARTVTMGTRFFVRRRGKPKPYPLEDD